MHKYQVTLTKLDTEAAAESLSFEIHNHDDLFLITEAVRSKGILDKDKAAALAVGLKVFSEVVLEHRHTPPFEAMWGPLREFIQELKKLPDAAHAISPLV